MINHEISHGFDDQGSQYGGDGSLRDWWTQDDHDKFAERTRALVTQYSAYSLPGYNVSSELTLENIADNSGLAIAYKAYRISIGDAKSPVIEGLTGDQRLYMGWAQVWRSKARDAEVVQLLKVDPHSPMFRYNGSLINQSTFYAAFGVKEGDKMFMPPETGDHLVVFAALCGFYLAVLGAGGTGEVYRARHPAGSHRLNRDSPKSK